MPCAKVIVMPRRMKNIERKAYIVKVMVVTLQEMFQEMAVVVVEYILGKGFGKLGRESRFQEILQYNELRVKFVVRN